jgi:hypothetical protein
MLCNLTGFYARLSVMIVARTGQLRAVSDRVVTLPGLCRSRDYPVTILNKAQCRRDRSGETV